MRSINVEKLLSSKVLMNFLFNENDINQELFSIIVKNCAQNSFTIKLYQLNLSGFEALLV